MCPSPSLLFILGAWHKATCYSKITTLLEEQHHLKCISVTLPSTTGNLAVTFKDDVDTAGAAISSETTVSRDVVVSAHSYGGTVANSAIYGFAKPRETTSSSIASNEEGHVVWLILIASGFNLTGLAFMDPFLGHPTPWRVNAATGFAKLVTPGAELLYHDLPAEEAVYWVSQLQSQSLKALFERGEHSFATWLDVPAWYIGTLEDYGLPVMAQRLGVGMARGMGGRVVHREM